jgi:peptidoglycan/LPS O-acetylase OafA/YrhL
MTGISQSCAAHEPYANTRCEGEAGPPAADVVRATKLPERNLDVPRAMAVLLVLGDHAIAATGVHATGGWNWAIGRVGVLFFFVHTSQVLMPSLERGGASPDWVRRFYVRRAFRIYPPAVVVLVAALARLPAHVTFDGWDMVRGFPPCRTLLSDLLLVQNVTGALDIQGVFWSLPLEV